MRLVVAVVGKARNPALGEAIRDYETRAARYWPLDVHEVREERATGISIESVKEREGKRLSGKDAEGAESGRRKSIAASRPGAESRITSEHDRRGFTPYAPGPSAGGRLVRGVVR